LSDDEKQKWKQWENWDAMRHARDLAIFEKRRGTAGDAPSEDAALHVPKKRKGGSNIEESLGDSFHVPKKKRPIDN
jgi:hypothetical protein